MQTFGDEARTARKPRPCSYCAATIQPGQVYRRWASEDGGTAMEVSAHPGCVGLWRTIAPHEDEIPLDPYEFRQDCHAYGGPGPFPWKGAGQGKSMQSNL
jgi:hypothetical protein